MKTTLSPHELNSLSSPLSAALVPFMRRFPGDGGAVGLVGVDEDFFLIVRVANAPVP